MKLFRRKRSAPTVEMPVIRDPALEAACQQLGAAVRATEARVEAAITRMRRHLGEQDAEGSHT